MARLVFPENFQNQLILLNNIATQNTALGSKSPLTTFLTQQNIVLEDDVNAGTEAQTHETSRALQSKQSQNFSQLRNNQFAKPWQHLTGSVQFLKSFYKGNTKQLGSWGITITDGGKVNYPTAFSEKVTVFNSLVAQNDTFIDGTSPLAAYLDQQGIDFKKDVDLVSQAVENDTSFVAAAKKSEDETELRNLLWEPVLLHLKAIGNFLMKLNQNNEKALGIWGFVVDDSSKKAKLRTTKLKLGEKITIMSIHIGSTLTNTGFTDLYVYKGKSTDGNPAIIHKGEQLGMQKGYSTITVMNPSMLETAVFTATING